MACQVRGWWPVLSWPARAWAGRPVSVARQGWAGGLVSRLARTEAGGRRIGPPGQGLVGRCRPCSRSGLESRHGASCQAHWAYASGIPGHVRGLSLGMSGWYEVSTCRYVYVSTV